MDQYTNYFDALSQPMYSQQPSASSNFLSSDSCPPSLSASPVSSEGSDSLIDEAFRYSFFGYDNSPAAAYNPYDQNSVNSFGAGSMTPMNDHSSPAPAVKHDNSFGYDSPMAFDGGLTLSLTTYQPIAGYAAQEHSSILGYPNPATNLANTLADSAPFSTVTPSATSGYTDEETSAYNLSADIAELSISSPASSSIHHAASLSSSPLLIPILQPPPAPACDPKVLESPVIVQSPAIQCGPFSQAEGSRRTRASSYRPPTEDSDYSPSGESEIEDDNDQTYGEPSTRKKTRSARVSHAAHPYLRPAPKSKSNKPRGTKLETPVPVPGLTKTSRGRIVPKKTETVVVDPSRPYWCSVVDCNKLFGRGEHLKRHIQSIHTPNKPFECECGNTFSRQDNMFQHMRAKGCVRWYKNVVPQTEPEEEEEDDDDDDESIEVGIDTEDLYIQQVMADAEKAQEKRNRACKPARSFY